MEENIYSKKAEKKVRLGSSSWTIISVISSAVAVSATLAEYLLENTTHLSKNLTRTSRIALGALIASAWGTSIFAQFKSHMADQSEKRKQHLKEKYELEKEAASIARNVAEEEVGKLTWRQNVKQNSAADTPNKTIT